MNRYDRLIWLKTWYSENKDRLQTQPAQVEAIRADHNIEFAIRDLYEAIFNKALGGCGSCLADALCVLLHYPNEKMQAIMECKFKLKSGVLLVDVNSKLPMATRANLTDEVAIAYLRDNIERKSLFEVLPENLDELLAEPAAKQEEPAQITEPEPEVAPVKKATRRKSK